MQKINFTLISIILMSSFTQCMDDIDQLYSTTFLKNYDCVRATLKKYDFKEIAFTTPDHLTLRGLFLSRPHATCNVIICAGWLPGKKEGMATFYDLLPEYCNILLFDARGHGESDGQLVEKLWYYGMNEYKDIIGAINYLNVNNDHPIIIAGICSGAFNAAHALIHLEQQNKTAACNIKGLVFDSGWGSIREIFRTAPPAGIEKRLVALCSSLYTTKEQIKQSIFYKTCSLFGQTSFKLCYYFFSKLYNQDHATTLYNKIDLISSPILFIHSTDDTYATYKDAVKLARLAQQPTCWWIAKSSHAKHHLIHRDAYKEKLTTFITQALQQ
jgi:pimeloyl-ACP methyl ester carboxylesterase